MPECESTHFCDLSKTCPSRLLYLPIGSINPYRAFYCWPFHQNKGSSWNTRSSPWWLFGLICEVFNRSKYSFCTFLWPDPQEEISCLPRKGIRRKKISLRAGRWRWGVLKIVGGMSAGRNLRIRPRIRITLFRVSSGEYGETVWLTSLLSWTLKVWWSADSFPVSSCHDGSCGVWVSFWRWQWDRLHQGSAPLCSTLLHWAGMSV